MSASRVAELDKLLQQLYEDNVLGKLSYIRYKAMSENMEKEYEYLVTKRKEIQDKLSETDKTKKNAEDFAEIISKYVGITELDYDILHVLIDKIVVHQREEVDGKNCQKIDIYYRFIGNATNDITIVRKY